MRMSFAGEDEDAFQARRDEVLDEYAAWLASSNVTDDAAGDAGVALLGDDIDDEEPIAVGPVTLPDPAQRAESAAAAPVLAQMRALCDNQRSLETAKDLPELRRLVDLGWLVDLAIEARVLHRHQGRLVAVARWQELSPVQAIDRLVEHAVEAGLSGSCSDLDPIREVLDGSVGRLLAELIDCQAIGIPMAVDELTELMAQVMAHAFAGLPESRVGVIRGWVRTQLDRLACLGIVTLPDQAHSGTVELTPVGVPVAVRLAEELGITVLHRPDPATATARDLVTLIEHMQPPAWLTDAAAWVAHRGAEPAARELIDVLTDPQTATPVALAVLTQLDGLVGEHAVPAIRTMLDGPRDSVAVQALLASGDLDPATLDPARVLHAGIEMLAVAYHVGGPDDLIGALDAGDAGPDGQLAILDHFWRTDHPRVAELLEVIGQHHPDKKVAKSARKALLKHRSFLASAR